MQYEKLLSTLSAKIPTTLTLDAALEFVTEAAAAILAGGIPAPARHTDQLGPLGGLAVRAGMVMPADMAEALAAVVFKTTAPLAQREQALSLLLHTPTGVEIMREMSPAQRASLAGPWLRPMLRMAAEGDASTPAYLRALAEATPPGAPTIALLKRALQSPRSDAAPAAPAMKYMMGRLGVGDAAKGALLEVLSSEPHAHLHAEAWGALTPIMDIGYRA